MIHTARTFTLASLTLIALATTVYVMASADEAATSIAKEPAATQPATSPAAFPTIGELAWMRGDWRGEAFGGRVEEHWLAPDGGSMLGLFRHIGNDGKMRVCEFMMIEQEKDATVYRFRHYNPGLKPWEPDDKPLMFHLVRTTEREAVFEHPGEQDPKRLIYRRAGKTGLTVIVEVEKDGKVARRFEVKMKRPKTPRD